MIKKFGEGQAGHFFKIATKGCVGKPANRSGLFHRDLALVMLLDKAEDFLQPVLLFLLIEVFEGPFVQQLPLPVLRQYRQNMQNLNKQGKPLQMGQSLDPLTDLLFTRFTENNAVGGFGKQLSDSRQFGALRQSIAQEISSDVQHQLFVFCLDAVIEIQMGNIRADEDEIVFPIPRHVVPDVPVAVGSVDEHQLVFRVKVPEEEIIEPGVHHEVEGAVFAGADGFVLDFHGGVWCVRCQVRGVGCEGSGVRRLIQV